MKQVIRSLALAAIGLIFAFGNAQAATSSDGLWSDVNERAVARAGERQIVPQRYRTLRLDMAALDALLQRAPLERNVPAVGSATILQLPLADGDFGAFRISESPVLNHELARRYPQLRTFVGQGIDDPSATLRLDVTPKGFHAQVLSAHGTQYIDPFQKGDIEHYIAYAKHDHAHGEEMLCEVTGESVSKESPADHLHHLGAKVSSGGTLRTYRLAMAATGEYTVFHGGTVLDGLAAITTLVNRITGIYEREISVRFELVANNDLLVFTNPATDPYSNTSGDLEGVTGSINTRIGVNAYDVGHLVGTGGGGVAGLGVICTASKGRGLTGSGSPVGDAFDVDYVAHEMGHQFGGNHTFNGAGCGGQRNGSTAYEPGSGVTIQAYAGICGDDNLQPNSEDYFHRVSLNEMIAHSTTGSGGSCGTTNATGNAIPTVTTAPSHVIPRSTPFELVAAGTDGDGDTLTYVWEQFDIGAANAEGSLTDNGTRALFRGFSPEISSRRVFPSLRYILDHANTPPSQLPLPGTDDPDWFSGELLPTMNRELNFRVTVRDNRAGGGGTNEAATEIQVVAAAGPFVVTAPNTAVSWAAGSAQTVTWNVANTTAAPVSTANVSIDLSLDGGYTWPVEWQLAASVPNSGSANITIPAGTPASTQARVRVRAVGNIFFDISNTDFTITGTNTPPQISGDGTVTTRQGSSPTASAVVRTVQDDDDAADSLLVAVSENPEELTVSVSNDDGQVTLNAAASCTLVAPTSGTRTYPVRLTVTDLDGASTSEFVNVLVGRNLTPTLGTYANATVGRSTTVPLAPSAAAVDGNGNLDSVLVTPSSLPGGGTIVAAANGTLTITTTATTTLGSVPIQVQVLDSCGAVETRTFTLTIDTSDAALAFDDATILTGNGLIEPAECNQMEISLTNVGLLPATAVSATLSTTASNVTVTQPVASFPDIPPGQSRSSSTPFQISSGGALVCFSDIDFSISVEFAGGPSPHVEDFSLVAGQVGAANYTFASSEDASIPAGGSLIAGSAADDALVNITVPAGFNFEIYDLPVSAGTVLRASTNGTLQFIPSNGSRQYDNGALPNTGIGNFGGDAFPASAPTLMPFWDDLRLDLSGGGGGIYTHLDGTAPNRRFVIEWRGRHWTSTAGAQNTNFAIAFREGSSQFEYHYVQASGGGSLNGGSATIGVQAASSGTQFTQFSFNTTSIIAGRRLTATRATSICSAGAGACAAGLGVLITESDGDTTVAEGGAGDSYTVVLTGPPSGDVTIAVTPDAQLSVDPVTLTFTTANWDVAQSVDVEAIDDAIVEGPHAGTITHAASGGGYTGVSIAPVEVSILDNEFDVDLAVQATLVSDVVLPGQPVTIEVTVANLSTILDVPNATFDFDVIPELENLQWTCVADPGATCPPSGSGMLFDSLSLDANTGVLYEITGIVPSSAPFGSMISIFADSGLNLPYTDPNPSNNSDGFDIFVAGYSVFVDGFEEP